MPEGHTIHRLARDLSADLAGGPVRATSPQRRFSDGAARIDGVVLERAEAWGKHLFCAFASGDVLHVHLGLIGKFRPRAADDEPRDTVRLVLAGPGASRAWHLTGPQTCAVIAPDDRDRITTGLGPDPLRRGASRARRFVERLARTRRPIGATLLDQSVIAGIGNVYRAELLWIVGVHPQTPSADVEPATAQALWDHAVEQLGRGVRWNRIVTVTDAGIGRRVTRRIRREDALAVYKRGGLPCRRCATPIAELAVGGRTIAYCPICQPAADTVAPDTDRTHR